MDTERWRSAFLRDVDRFATAVDGRWDRPVPTCPDWRVRDLAVHLGGVVVFWTAIGTGAVDDPSAFVAPPIPPDDELADALRSAGRDAAAVYDLDPALPRWSWSPNKTVGFIHRRLVHETAIHLVDAQLATTGVEPVDRAIAVDGVDELLDTFWTDRLPSAPPIDLQAVDTDDRWRIGPPDGLPEVSIEATASDLYLLLWRRPTARTPVIDGDDDVWDDFYEAIAIS